MHIIPCLNADHLATSLHSLDHWRVEPIPESNIVGILHRPGRQLGIDRLAARSAPCVCCCSLKTFVMLLLVFAQFPVAEIRRIAHNRPAIAERPNDKLVSQLAT
jgi:hypothetical protein